MNRCIRILCTLTVGLSAAIPLVGTAQTVPNTRVLTYSTGTVNVAVRTFPPKAVRGTLQIVAPPDVLLNNKSERLSPGSRIRGANGMLAMSASLVGQTLPVMVIRESHGMLHEIWVLTDIEAKLIPATPAAPQ